MTLKVNMQTLNTDQKLFFRQILKIVFDLLIAKNRKISIRRILRHTKFNGAPNGAYEIYLEIADPKKFFRLVLSPYTLKLPEYAITGR